MGLVSLVTRAATTILPSWFNDLKTALCVDLVPRNASGDAEDGAGSLGTEDYAWADLHVGRMFLGGELLDVSEIQARPHRILSGKAKTSGYPDFLTAAGTGNGRSVTLDCTPTALVAKVNGTDVSVSSDLTFTSLTAAPSSNNTCLVNDTGLSDQAFTKLLGEWGEGYITIDTAGSGITALDGLVAAFGTSTEVFLALVDTTNNRLWPIYRGWAGTSRVTLANNDTITLLKFSTLLLKNDGVTKAASTYFPASVTTAPAAGTAGKIYLERETGRVAYDDGSDIDYDYMIVGWAVCDTTDCLYTQPWDFDLGWKSDLGVETILRSSTVVRFRPGSLSINGTAHDLVADVDVSSSSLDSGEALSADSTYFLYMKATGEVVLSTVAPRRNSLVVRGLYHPQNYYRCVGLAQTDAASGLYMLDDGFGRDDRGIASAGVALSASKTVALPSPKLFKGRELTLRASGGSYTLTFTCSGEITDLTTYSENTLRAYESSYVRFYSDGSNWKVIDLVSNDLHSTSLSNWQGSGPVFLVTRRGVLNSRRITLTLYDALTASPKPNSTDPVTADALDAQFRPAVADAYGAFMYLANGSVGIGHIVVSTAGILTFNDSPGVGWSSGNDNTIRPSNITYH